MHEMWWEKLEIYWFALNKFDAGVSNDCHINEADYLAFRTHVNWWKRGYTVRKAKVGKRF